MGTRVQTRWPEVLVINSPILLFHQSLVLSVDWVRRERLESRAYFLGKGALDIRTRSPSVKDCLGSKINKYAKGASW